MSVHERYQTYIQDQRRFFDELITEEWDTYLSADWDEFRRYEVACLFDVVQPRTILDIGCGCGFHDAEMARYPFVERVDAIDYSTKSIAKASEVYPHAKVTRAVGDFASVTAAAVYELVVSFQLFEHLHNPGDYLNFCRASTGPGAHIAVFMPNRLRADNLWRLAKCQRPQLCDPQHFREYTAGELTRLARPYGFIHRATLGLGWPEAGGPGLKPRPLAERLTIGARWPFAASNIGVILAKAY